MVTSTSRRTRSNKKSTRPASGRKAAARHRAAASKAASAKSKWVYRFGNGKAEGRADMRNLLGGKGAGLAEMANLGLPVPPGFTITAAVAEVGRIAGKTFSDSANPLLVSVRSGARASMPGMMDTVLNLGLNDATVEAPA